MGGLIELLQLHFAPEEVCFPQLDHPIIFQGSAHSLAQSVGFPRSRLQAPKIALIKHFKPLTKGIAVEAEVAADEGTVLVRLLIIEDRPFQTLPGGLGQPHDLGCGPPAIGAVEQGTRRGPPQDSDRHRVEH